MTGDIRYVSLEDTLAIHARSIDRYGGIDGLRDQGLLESAIAQPQQTFDGVELYPSLAEKAARYAYGIIKNHPFADGNGRTGRLWHTLLLSHWRSPLAWLPIESVIRGR